jgi:hypothetical protein
MILLDPRESWHEDDPDPARELIDRRPGALRRRR